MPQLNSQKGKSKARYLKSGMYFSKKRLEANLSQNEASKALKVHSQLISNWERGLCKPPVHILASIMKVYKIPKKEMMTFLMQEQERLLSAALSNPSKAVDSAS